MREVRFFKRYFLDFYDRQRPQVQKKIDWTLLLVATLEKVPEKYLKFLQGTDGLYEVRIEVGSDIFRIFCFFDKGQLIILINGFQKKSQKTPLQEQERAEKLKKQYFDEQENK